MTAIGLLLLALQAEEVPGRWDGAPPGSWVVFGTRPMSEAVPRLNDTWRFDLAEPAPDGLPRLSEDGGSAVPQARLPVLGTGLREKARRADALVVGDRRLACTVVESLGDGGALTVWTAEGVRIPGREMAALPRRVGIPPGVVRVDGVYVEKSGRMRVSLEVTALAAPIEVAGRRLACVVETVTSVYERPGGGGCLRRWKRWLSEEVPGRLVRQDRQCTGEAAAPELYTTRDEVVDFRPAR
jgi:hypothetical protein